MTRTQTTARSLDALRHQSKPTRSDCYARRSRFSTGDNRQGSRGTPAVEREIVAKKIAEVTPKFGKCSIRSRRTCGRSAGSSASRGTPSKACSSATSLPDFRCTLWGKSRTNARIKDQTKHQLELIPLRGPLSMKIVISPICLASAIAKPPRRIGRVNTRFTSPRRSSSA
jgi:hypothetical protein